MKTPYNLRIYGVPEFGFGDYLYFVNTPENETFYFKDKKEAKSFIEFYQKHKAKKCQTN